MLIIPYEWMPCRYGDIKRSCFVLFFFLDGHAFNRSGGQRLWGLTRLFSLYFIFDVLVLSLFSVSALEPGTSSNFPKPTFCFAAQTYLSSYYWSFSLLSVWARHVAKRPHLICSPQFISFPVAHQNVTFCRRNFPTKIVLRYNPLVLECTGILLLPSLVAHWKRIDL